MKIITSVFKKTGLRYGLIAVFSLFFLNPVQAQSLPVYANAITSRSDTDQFTNAIDGNLATRANVRAGTGLVAGIGSYSGHIELQFGTLLPANTTSYVKIQTDENLLPSLLGGSLGGLLSNVLGSVLIGNQEFTIEAKNGANAVVLRADSQDIGEFATSRARIVVNAGNEYFIAITPSAAYNRIRLTNNLGSLIGLNNVKNLYVFDAFYIGTPDPCGSASYTSFDGSGLNLDLLGLGGAGVTNPQNVLTPSQTDFSRLSLGILAVAGSVEQTVYYDALSETSDQFFIRLKVDPSLLALGVANNIQIIASNGPTTVRTVNLNTLLNLDLLTLLQGSQIVTIPFSPNGTVNRITVRYNSLLNVQLTQSLDLYSITRAPAQPTITDPFTLNPVVCEGSTASLVAQTGTGTQLNWYATPQGGSILATRTSGQAFVTPALTQNTTYYVSAKRTNCPEESLRIPVTVNVINLPSANDILIANSLNACNGNITLSPTATSGVTAFRYYKDQAKTVEITSGYTGDPGVTYVKNPVTGELTISGLNAANSPYTYYISLTVNGLCENAINTLKAVTVNFSAVLNLQVSSAIQNCGSVNLRNAIFNFDNSADIQYNFFNSSNTPITAAAASNIQASGIYFIQAVSLGGSCSSAVQQVNVTVNPRPTLTIANPNVVVNVGSPVTLSATSSSTVIWYDSAGNALPSNTAGPFAQAGYFTFTAVASNGPCTATGTINVTVIDPANCPPLTQRAYANSQSWTSIVTGTVTNAAAAVDGNPQTFSTIITGLGLLGIGTTWQTLQWNQTIAAGTPVTVKLGSEYSGLTLAGAYSIVGTKRNTAGNPIDIGPIQPVSASLLNLLPGQNTFEFTFVPSDNSGPKNYDGVRIIVGSILSVAQNVKVYEAYYNTTVTQLACETGDVKDVFSGATDLGIGVATTAVGVDNPFNAVDGSITSFATMFSGAGVLAAADLTVVFKTPSLAGDSTELILSRPSTILDLNVLSGFTIQLFLGNTAVGAPIANTSTLLSLTLLNGGAQARLVIRPQAQQYDRIRIRLGGVASVLDQLRVHNVRRFANTTVVGADATNTVRVCQNDVVQLVTQPENCTTFIWYDAATGGNVVSTGTSFTVPTTLAAGTYNYYIQPVRFGCPVFDRGLVTIIVGQTAPATAISQITINGGAATTFCSTGNVTLTAVLNASATITNPVFYWYATNGTETTLIANQTAATLNLTGLAPGTYTYSVGVSSAEFCKTAPANRRQVTFTILPFSQPSDIVVANALICQSLNQAVLTPTTTRLNPQFNWYFSNNSTQPIVSGSTVNGVTYNISSTGALTASGLTLANSPYTYYVGLTSSTTCLNQAGNFKPVTITVNDSGTPTTNNTTQNFCLSDAPTIASIQVNQANVVFYTAATGGTLLSATTALANATTYYAAFSAATGCASAVRLPILVNVNNAPTPTTTNAAQSFCIINAPTVANLQVNQANVNWFLSATGGTALAPTTRLVNGTTYFGSLTNTANGCQSAVRLAIAVTLNDADTPTTASASQSFCLVNNPTVASIQVNQTGVVWYNVATGGTPLAATTPLTNGIYYGSLTAAGTGCQSSVRLAVTVEITNPAAPTTLEPTQQFCLISAATIANIQVNEANIIWYTAATGGSVLPTTTVLVNGTTYFAALVDNITGCQSASRLAVTVNITDPGTPTTSDNMQEFCLSANPTVANIQVNGANVTFYNSPTGGTAFATTDVLVDGTIYYASFTAPVSGCESAVRLAITATLNNPGTPTTNSDSQTFCLINNSTVASIQVNQTNIVFYDAASGGTPLSLSDPLANGTYYVALNDPGNCESAVRLAIAVLISDPGTPTTTDDSQNFCLINNPTIANIQVNETNVIFYDLASGGTALDPATVLVNGTTYYASITDTNGCSSATRLAINVVVSDPGTPTTSDASQDFCLASNPTVANIQVNEANVIFYNAATGGTAYATTDALINGNIYYASLTDADGCQSAVRLAITVNVNNAGTPTTNDSTQNFCLVNNPTVANLQINESNVAVYNVATGGTSLAATDILTNGTYYISFTGANCESAVRLEIAVTVSDPGTPTTTDDSQNFCLINNPTIANIQVNETNVTFYNAATGGTAYATTDVLVSGIYYASISDANGCASAIRLAISVIISDPGIPTTADATQDFCLAANPTVANIQVNEANVVFYNAATGGTAYAATEALVSGNIYYASLTDANGCQSAIRLAITVNINNAGTPTTNDTTQDFCLVDNPTVASLQINESNVAVYNVATGGTALAATDILANGTYYVSFTGGANCESAVRLEIVVTVSDPGTPTTSDASQDFCLINNPTIANIQVNESNVTFYNAATGGTAYATTDVLLSGTYYASISDVNGCASAIRLAISVIISDPGTPTTADATQDFCLAANPTVANIQVNEANVIFYNAATGGTAYAVTEALVSGNIYYASLTDVNGCQSAIRQAITVNVNNAGTPTTNDTTQDFCLANNPTVANLQVNESNVAVYNVATGGTALAATDILTNGTYYVSFTGGANCESATRLAIAVTVNDAATPTTNNPIQDFCQSANPTVANIQLNQSNITWFTSATGGTPLAASTPLTAGIYYAAYADPANGCSSSVRLAVTVTFSGSVAAVITGGSAEACVFESVTYTTNTGMTNYIWTVSANGNITAGGQTGDNFVTVSWTAIGAASVGISYTDACGDGHSASFPLTVKTCSDITITKTVDNPAPFIDQNVTFTITVQNSGSGQFQNIVVSENLPSGYGFVSASATAGTYSNVGGNWSIPVLNANQTATLTVVVKVLGAGNYLNIASITTSNPEDSNVSNNSAEAEIIPQCLIVYNEFSPNNDNSNELFRIDCIENYPNNKLEVFNRYGVLVYKKNNYANDWDGTANVSGAINKDDKLPTGTYYYILNIGVDDKVLTGWVSIMR